MLMGHSHKHPPTHEEVLIFQHMSTSKFLRILPFRKAVLCQAGVVLWREECIFNA